jgi:hypothetical protein
MREASQRKIGIGQDIRASESQPSPSIPNQRCKSLRKDGQPCQAPATSGEYCPSHDPVLKNRMAEARKLGGQNKSKAVRAQKLMPAHLKPVYGLLAKALLETYHGSLPPAQATALSSLASTMVKVLTAGELESRLRDLEVEVSTRRQGNG